MNRLMVLLVASLCFSGAFCQVMVAGTWALEQMAAQSVAVPSYAYPQSSPNQQASTDISPNQQPNVVYFIPQAYPFAAPQNSLVPSSLSYPQYFQTPYGVAPPSPQKLVYPPSMAPGMNRFYPGYPTGAAPLTPCQLMKQLNDAQNQIGHK